MIAYGILHRQRNIHIGMREKNVYCHRSFVRPAQHSVHQWRRIDSIHAIQYLNRTASHLSSKRAKKSRRGCWARDTELRRCQPCIERTIRDG